MKNKREIYQALLDGKKLVESNTGLVIELVGGILRDSTSKEVNCEFIFPLDWQIYEEPKERKLFAFKETSYSSVIVFFTNKDYGEDEFRAEEYDIVFNKGKE